MVIRCYPTLLLVAALLPAQDAPKTAADPTMTAKVTKALQATAQMKNTAFGASWGPDGLPKDSRLPPAVFERMTGKVSGAFFADGLSVRFDNQEHDELLQVGRHTLARSGDGAWRLRKDSYADGNAISFVPDPPLLLRLLASFELPLTQRAVATLDNQPVEIVSAMLTPAQIGELIFAGAMPKPFAATTTTRVGGAGRAPAATPEATVDVAIAFDPATGAVHRVQLRTYSKRSGGAAVLIGGRGVGKAPEPEKQPEAPVEPQPGAPVQYVDGLPARPSDGMTVTNFEVRIRDHGKVPVAPLDAEQQRLLGR
jgi:hypothetical protein